MKQPLVFIALIFSGLALNAQNIVTQQVNYTWANNNNNGPDIQQNANTQQLTNVYLNSNTQVYNVQINNNKKSSALGNLSNNSNKTQTNKIQVQAKTTANKPKVQTNVNPVINEDDNSNPVGNQFNNLNVADNNVGENVQVQMINDVSFNSNPVVHEQKKVVANKPIVEYQGLDFKPSGLSGRDYSNGGKLKKGQKNFYTGSTTKHKTVHKRKPSFKKVKHHTSKCAKW